MNKWGLGAAVAASLVACGGMTAGVGDGDASTTSSSSTTSSGGRSSGSTTSSGFPSSSGSSSGNGDCPADVSVTAADLDAEIGWKSATPQKGACSSTDITQLEKNFGNTNITSYFDLGKNLSSACRACVLSKDTDPSWGPIVGTASDGGQTGFVNYGACFGEVDGAACGKAIEYEQLCYSLACSDCAATSAAQSTCIEAAGTGVCADFQKTTTSACPNLQTDAKSCNAILEAVRTLCGS